MKFKLVTAILAAGVTALANSWSGNRIDYNISPEKPAETKVVSSLDGVWKVTPPVKTSTLPTVADAEKSGKWKPTASSSDWVDIEVPHGSWHSEFPNTYPDPKKVERCFTTMDTLRMFMDGFQRNSPCRRA